jgi:hypothetical protein
MNLRFPFYEISCKIKVCKRPEGEEKLGVKIVVNRDARLANFRDSFIGKGGEIIQELTVEAVNGSCDVMTELACGCISTAR